MQDAKNKTKTGFNRYLPLLSSIWPLPAAGIFLLVYSRDPDMTERGYSTTIYPAITNFSTIIGKFLPASMAELTMISGLLFAVVMGLRLIFMMIGAKKKARKKMLSDALLAVLAVVSYLVLGFVLLCAPNYHRQPFTYYSRHVVAPATLEELEELSLILGQNADELRPLLMENDEGRVLLTGKNLYSVAALANGVMADLGETYPVLGGITPSPKPVAASFILNRLQLSGFFFPYFTEANFNSRMPTTEMPFTMLHELAHAQGFMREDEANFIAYLACRDSDNPDFAYSGNLMALRYCLSALAGEDTEAYYRVYEGLSEAVRRDIVESRAHWDRYDGTLADISDRVNDVYLRVNSQHDGTKSYGRVVDLLIAEYRLW